MIKLADVQREIGAIRALYDEDSEAAHVREDKLCAAVLGAIAEGVAEEPRVRAVLVTALMDTEYDRWYA